ELALCGAFDVSGGQDAARGGFDPQYAAPVIRPRCATGQSFRVRVEEFEGNSIPEPLAPCDAGRTPRRSRKQSVIRGERGPQQADWHPFEHRARAARMVAVVVGDNECVEAIDALAA